MIEAYRINQNFGFVRDQLQRAFPSKSKYFTNSEIKDRFDSALRAAMRVLRLKLKEEIAKGN
jgi:hypothetical protein